MESLEIPEGRNSLKHRALSVLRKSIEQLLDPQSYLILQYGSSLLNAEMADSDFDIVLAIAEGALEAERAKRNPEVDQAESALVFSALPPLLEAKDNVKWVLSIPQAK